MVITTSLLSRGPRLCGGREARHGVHRRPVEEHGGLLPPCRALWMGVRGWEGGRVWEVEGEGVRTRRRLRVLGFSRAIVEEVALVCI